MAWSETTREKYNRSSARYESDLTDEEWLLVEPLLPPPAKLGRRRTADLREICNAIHYMLATGCQKTSDSQVLSAVYDGPELLLRLARRRRHRAHDGCGAHTGP